MKVLGIDPSTSATGLIVIEADKPCAHPNVVTHHVSKQKDADLRVRQEAIVNDILGLITDHKPQRIVIENYGLNFKHSSSVVPLCELGGVIRYHLFLLGRGYLAPTPSEMKEFITGSGKGSGTAVKKKVRKAVLDRWGFQAKSYDEADAFGVAIMGLAHAGLVTGLSPRQRELVGAMSSS